MPRKKSKLSFWNGILAVEIIFLFWIFGFGLIQSTLDNIKYPDCKQTYSLTEEVINSDYIQYVKEGVGLINQQSVWILGEGKQFCYSETSPNVISLYYKIVDASVGGGEAAFWTRSAFLHGYGNKGGWLIGLNTYFNLSNVDKNSLIENVMHELGHAMGLGHIDNPECIMNSINHGVTLFCPEEIKLLEER